MTNAASVQSSVRGTDPNVVQSRASNPDDSVWVGASAGTGKTKVLTDRVLRLLLPRADGQIGTEPHRILGLTYTKAAAGEMLLRINKVLSEWAIIDDHELEENLQKLTGRTPDEPLKTAARSLFAKVVDTPGGLKIMTIHSFCQSILGRFPLEAGISPHFKVLEESEAREMLSRARQIILGQNAENQDLQAAMTRIAAYQNEQQFESTLGNLLSERRLLLRYGMDMAKLKTDLFALYGLDESYSADDFKAVFIDNESFNFGNVYAACKALAASDNANDRQRGIDIQLWLDADATKRAAKLDEYKSIYLTGTGTIRKTLITKNCAKEYPEAAEYLETEALRVHDYAQTITILESIQALLDIFGICHSIIDNYQRQKERQGLLDFDDMIYITENLLQNEQSSAWVMYKLDGGLDHLLIDEAQDTSPEQWEIIQNLCAEFFTGEGTREEIVRTIFAVGDKKQSIYSFQRAAPEGFEEMQAHFEHKASAKPLKMDVSFRSTATILDIVDRTFAPAEIRQGLENDIIKHESFRKGQAGITELWPLEKPDTADEEEPWDAPITITEQQSGEVKLANKIADQVKNWLDNDETLESFDRPIKPGDIMILVQTRTAFQARLVRALKSRNIPVSGIDRMVLGDQIAVMDLLALARFALLPEDDLSLACILKSPLIGWADDTLFTYAYDREKKQSLWARLQNCEDKAVLSYLQRAIKDAATMHPFYFFGNILQTPCPASDVSGLHAIHARLGVEAFDPLDEFMNACQNYEQNHVASLQGFLVWQQKDDIVIKRELEEAGGAVRIMTVHGSKGLQAPIVFLPDTTRTPDPRKKPAFLWPDKTGLNVPLWSPKKSMNTPLVDRAQELLFDKEYEEYRRLLYVAMTRAEERLYVCGYKKKSDPSAGNWHELITNAFHSHPECKTIECDDGDILRITDPRTKDQDRKKDATTQKAERNIVPLPQWAHEKPKAEPFPSRPMAPSRPSGQQPAARSPLHEAAEQKFLRGNITHKLLQLLPDLPSERRAEAARHYLGLPAHDLSQTLQDSIFEETMAILTSPDYAFFFGVNSLAEVPVTGFVNNMLVSGQIDRLYVSDTEIHILDFKTNRPPPKDPANIPDIYRQQMKAYRDIVSNIYPDRKVYCYLLWTDGANLVKLPDL